MRVAVVIGTHGDLACQLLRTAEMLIGKQDNVACVDFLPDENVEILVEKYGDCVAGLDSRKGTIFLVDMWGGSPFNAASRLVGTKVNQDVVTGVNVPMMVEVLMLRDDDLPLEELVRTAIESGRTGIKTLRFAEILPSVGQTIGDRSDPVYLPSSPGERGMDIRLARIDDRLIHGQVVTSWVRSTGVSCIIVVNDEIARDDVRRTLLTQVSPPGISSHVVDVGKLMRVYSNPKYSGRPVMLLFSNPNDVLRAVEMGLPISSVNIGGMAYRRGKRKVSDAVSLTEGDVQAFKRLAALKIRLEIRQVFGDPAVDMVQLMERSGIC